MKSHNGMRPQDIVILLKVLTNSKLDWQYRDIANDINISISEISESLNRSHLAGLVDVGRKKIFRKSLIEFLEYGLRYVFPQQPGTIVTGVPTAHSHPYFKNKLIADLDYVWYEENGTTMGLSIKPLYKTLPKVVQNDELLYLLLAAIDIIREGNSREFKMAIDVLKKEIL